nr:transport protein particle subunit trs85-2 [Quercus suber]
MPDDALQSTQLSESETIPVAKRPSTKRTPLSSISSLPYRRSNASLSNLFASTSSLPGSPVIAPSDSGTVTPGEASNGLSFFPGSSTAIQSPSLSPSAAKVNNETRDLIIRSYAPHVSILASQDTEELVHHKGVSGGLLELLRPFGEQVQGKVTIRDSSGVSRSYEDFGVRFLGVKDGLESPRFNDRRSTDSTRGTQRDGKRTSLPEFKPARLRTGGDVPQIEELVDRHLTFAEEQSGPVDPDYLTHKENSDNDARVTSPFYVHYLRRLLSGLPMTPSETVSHPVASVIAISSRSASPIEELRNLFSSSNTGEHRLPQWVHNEFLRYYVLVHDEDYDDITKSMALFDQMKRHFGLHCHLLRLRTTQASPSDDGAIKLPQCEWMSAAEELAEIVRREANDDDEDLTPWIYETDVVALRAFVREMVTQSIVPSMERASATWNDQVASRRRGLSGRFMSLSKRFTAFGGRNSPVPALSGTGSNYDSLQGFYKPDAPEALMRKLADYGMMLRDYKLALSTYEILCQDFKNDKAWRYYAGANEMAAITSLLVALGGTGKIRVDAIDQYLDTAYYSYITRVGSSYNALRTLAVAIELLMPRGSSASDEAAKWSNKIIEDRLVGQIGHVLYMERIAICHSERKGVAGLNTGQRQRKAALWNVMAADAWLRMEKASQAEKRLELASRFYHSTNSQGNHLDDDRFRFLAVLQEAVDANRAGPHHLDASELLADDDRTLVEQLQHANEDLDPPHSVRHKKSVSALPPPLPSTLQTSFDDPLGAVPTAYDGRTAMPLSPHASNIQPASPMLERRDPRDDGFE